MYMEFVCKFEQEKEMHASWRINKRKSSCYGNKKNITNFYCLLFNDKFV